MTADFGFDHGNPTTDTKMLGNEKLLPNLRDYSYKYRPKVLIFPTGGGFELQVEGMDRRIKVVCIR